MFWEKSRGQVPDCMFFLLSSSAKLSHSVGKMAPTEQLHSFRRGLVDCQRWLAWIIIVLFYNMGLTIFYERRWAYILLCMYQFPQCGHPRGRTYVSTLLQIHFSAPFGARKNNKASVVSPIFQRPSILYTGWDTLTPLSFVLRGHSLSPPVQPHW